MSETDDSDAVEEDMEETVEDDENPEDDAE